MAMAGATSKLGVVSRAAPGANNQTPVISLNPDTFVEGGGLINDVDVQITAVKFLLWDYNGKAAVEVPALGVTFRMLDEVAEADEKYDHDQYYSCGSKDDFVPNGDGSGLVPVGAKTGLNTSTNAGLFIASLVNAGLPKTVLDTGSVFGLTGLQVHVNRVKGPERDFGDQGGKKQGEVLLVTKIIALAPGAPAKAVTTGMASKSKLTGPAKVSVSVPAQVAATVDADPELDADITEKLVGLLAISENGQLQRKMIAPKMFAEFKGDPRQAAAMKRANSEEFLMTGGDGAFTYDGATITLGQ